MINAMLHNELLSLHENLKQLIEFLRSKVDPGNSVTFKTYDCRNRIKEAIERLEPISQLLDLHLCLDDTTIRTINFYSVFDQQFSGRYHKEAEYWIQDGYEGEKVLVTDKERLKREFTIRNCMNSLSLVPVNIASNAMKYMLPNQKAEVWLQKVPPRNILTISNYGPKNENIDALLEEGVRGENSEMAGMGLGLSIIRSVVEFHQPLLDSSIEIVQDNEVAFTKDGVDYTKFSVIFTYLTVPPQQSEVNRFKADFFNKIPLIIMHNMVDILANLFSITEKLQDLSFRAENNSRLAAEFRPYVDQFYLHIEKMQETIKLCLYMRNGYSTRNILGNVCPINVEKFSGKVLGLLNKYCYREKEIALQFHPIRPQIVETFSVVYPVIYGLCNAILDNAADESQIQVEMEGKTLSIAVNEIDPARVIYRGALPEHPEPRDLARIKSSMYAEILKDCHIGLWADEYGDDVHFTLNFENAKNDVTNES